MLGVIATVAANVVFGVHAGPVGAVISAWPAIAFIISTEILVGQMRRAGGIPTREEVSEAVAGGVPQGLPVNVPVIEPGNVTASAVPPAPATVPRTVPSGRARGRAAVTKARVPEKVFAAEIERGELPSLRAIKSRLHVGTDRARVVRDELAVVLEEAQPEAA